MVTATQLSTVQIALVKALRPLGEYTVSIISRPVAYVSDVSDAGPYRRSFLQAIFSIEHHLSAYLLLFLGGSISLGARAVILNTSSSRPKGVADAVQALYMKHLDEAGDRSSSQSFFRA